MGEGFYVVLYSGLYMSTLPLPGSWNGLEGPELAGEFG